MVENVTALALYFCQLLIGIATDQDAFNAR